MTLRKFIFIFICILLSSMMFPWGSHAQKKIEAAKDTTALFQGAVVGADLFGAVQRQVSDYGQYEAFLRLNLKGKFFPVFEFGRGEGKHDTDPITGISAETAALYGRIGCDFNVMKNKHDIYKLFVGVRYGYTSFDLKLSHPGVEDKDWGGTAEYNINEPCNAHWVEGVFGVDAKVVGPLHLGWTFRYRCRVASKSPSVGDAWYIPGYGRAGGSCLGGTFNLSFGI